MASILYYIPKRNTATPEKLRACGLGYIIPQVERTPATLEVFNGPDNGQGIVIMYSNDPEDPGLHNMFTECKETWQQIPKSDVWMAYHPEHRPTPHDLVRDKLVPGFPVPLGDGNSWLLPVIRALDDSTTLPRDFAFDGDDFAETEVKPAYRQLYEDTGIMWNAFVAKFGEEFLPEEETKPITVSISDELLLCARALSLNYRIGPAEISMLALFDNNCHGEAIKAILYWPGIEEIKKKAEAAGLFGIAGEEDSCPDTSPLLEK